MNKKQRTSPGITLGTHLRPYEAALIRARAAAGGRSPSAEIRLAVLAHLSDAEEAIQHEEVAA